MNKLSFFLGFWLLQSPNGNESSTEKSSKSCTDFSLKTKIRELNKACFKFETCQPLCCKLHYLYSSAKKNCNTDIDGQLAAAKWFSPFSNVYRRFWGSVCRPQSSDEWRTDVVHNYSVDLKNDNWQCQHFPQFSLNYSQNYLNFSTCDSSGDSIFWEWLPTPAGIVYFSLLIFTLLFFLLVPELHQRIQDKCLLLHLATRLFEAMIELCGSMLYQPSTNFGCSLMVFSDQCFSLAASFWFNVLCFHLWRSIKVPVVSSHQASAARFGHYSLYTFGSALSITVITHLAHHWLPNDSPFRLRFGQPLCTIKVYDYALGCVWFQPIFIYFYSVKTILTIFNLCAFIDIFHTISTSEKRFNAEDENLRRHKKQQFGISTYLKLFVLMGVMDPLILISIPFGHYNMVRDISHFLRFLNGDLFLWIILGREEVFHAVRNRIIQIRRKIIVQGTNSDRPTLTTE